jgi:phosphatidylserine/phosphatidylglycerophosphate/cardiolipin synthase-like enzyme
MVGIMHVGGLIQISEFCPDPWQYDDMDEYIVLYGTGSLDGVVISGEHGGFRFPAGTKIDGHLTIARDGPAYKKSHGSFPDFEWIDYSPEVRNIIPGDQLHLANAQGRLILYNNGNLVQEVSWPEDVKPREGQVHYCENGIWDPRPLMLGQSRFQTGIFRNVTVTTFVSPDCSNEVFSSVMNQASGKILLNMYEFSSPSMGDLLVAAKNRGVDVRVLIEGGPVGGISNEEKSLIWNLTRSGIPVVSMTLSKTEHPPYRYDHAKYAVVDSDGLLITSENFKYSGFPPKGVSGNRGWGVFLKSPALATYFSTVFTTDVSNPSVVPYAGQAADSETVLLQKHVTEFVPGQFEDATVIPVIAPDTSYQINDLLNSAEESIEIEQAYIKNETPLTLNPYLSSAINASRRGVHVRVLLDSYWFNIEGPNDNDEMVSLINRIGNSEHIPLEARCIDLSVSQLEKIHNKGVIVDDKRVLVSSINWNTNSPNFNREAGVIIDHPGVANYFHTVFEDDWSPRYTSPEIKTWDLKVAVALAIIGLLVVLYYHRRRL